MEINKKKHLEGLRGLAALFVFFSHMRYLLFKESFEKWNEVIKAIFPTETLQNFIIEFKNLFFDGTLCVWIFWILSAYVLSIKLFQKNDNLIIYKSFIKRYLRLFIPITASILIALIFMKFNLFFNKSAAIDLKNLGINHYWLNSFYNFDFDLWKFLGFTFIDVYFSYNLDYTYNSVLWSIQNEFLGSLLIFSIFGIIKTNFRRFYIYCFIALFLIVLDKMFFIPFLLGYALCDFDYTKNHHSFIIKVKNIENQFFNKKYLSLFTILFLIIASKVLFLTINSSNELIYLTQSFLIFYLALRNKLISNFLSLKWIYKFGNLSFSFYLLHMIIVCSLSSYLITLGFSFYFKLLIILITFLVSVLISIPFYHFIDKFAVTISNQFANYITKKKSHE